MEKQTTFQVGDLIKDSTGTDHPVYYIILDIMEEDVTLETLGKNKKINSTMRLLHKWTTKVS